jgi:hypothetical protein
MFGSRRTTVLMAAVAACSAALSLAAQPASGQLVDRGHDHFTDTFAGQVCGINVNTTITVVMNGQERLASSGFPLFQSEGVTTVTWTNPTTGESLSARSAGVSKDLSVTDNGDGTITVLTAFNGLAEKLTLSDGTIMSMDVGRIIFATVLDYNGTPTNPDDDTFVSSNLVSYNGPHPDAASDFSLFCSVVTQALG